ncbi:potassium channel SKOR [Micractinium conductrix]|uniref:Potassium channel SKOR n=1 Tax=Micractinium conductrix TaxID=554055 RepID=A0A2P6VCW6_9CHLO|nr:potassium channel SKOR [Micractinium conductrix]|eukprot:PSC71927.1 potassium channel SKOR [Micractinium conductrix]
MPLRRRATAAARRAPRLVASAWEGRPAERAWRASGSGDGGAPPPPPDGPGGWLAGLRLPSAVLPWDRRYLTWSPVVTVAAALSGFLIPWEVAFVPAEELYSLGSPWALLNLLLVGMFGLDLVLSFRLAYFEGEVLQDDPAAMSRHYLRTDFAADMLGFIPADWLLLGAVAAAGLAGDDALLGWLPVLRLLHLARLYRVRDFFCYLEYNLNVSLLQVTIIRNLAIVLLITHWTACGFFLAGVHSGFSGEVLYGADSSFLEALAQADQYVYSLYWAVTTLSMVEANSVPQTMAETVSATVRASLFMLFNTALGSYIVGTITLLVVKADERTGNFREQSANLIQYTQTNRIPPELKESMQEHLRLHFDTQDASDEQVLSIFPTTIRRRILQYLYMKHLRACYLFRKCPQRFLDMLLASARVEVFMPGVDILSSGDTVSELFLLLSGTAEVVSPDPAATAARASSLEPQGDSQAQSVPDGYATDDYAALPHPFWGDGSGSAGSLLGSSVADVRLNPNSPISMELPAALSRRRPVEEGSILGEAAFFTEVPQLEAVRSLTVCRVLVISRATYTSVERSFPNSARLVLHNLKRKAENAVSSEFKGKLRPADLDALWTHFSRLQFGWASTELQDDIATVSLPSLDHHDLGDVAHWSPRQQQVMSNLLRIRAVAQQCILRQEVERTTEFLWAASQGNETKRDYDGRTALELAVVKGHAGVVQVLLTAGADANLQDQLGSCALLEACKYGHDDLIVTLKKSHASLDGHKSSVEQAAVLCTAVFDGDLPLLRRLLLAGVAVDAGDYDKRTALHISAAEGNLQAVRLLLEEGRANPGVVDRWGYTPVDEAVRVQAGPVIRYFAKLGLLSFDKAAASSGSGGGLRGAAGSSGAAPVG